MTVNMFKAICIYDNMEIEIKCKEYCFENVLKRLRNFGNLEILKIEKVKQLPLIEKK